MVHKTKLQQICKTQTNKNKTIAYCLPPNKFLCLEHKVLAGKETKCASLKNATNLYQ